MHSVQSKAKSRPDTHTFLKTAWSITERLQRDKMKKSILRSLLKLNYFFFQFLNWYHQKSAFLRISDALLGKSRKHFGLEENKHNLATGLLMTIWKTSRFGEHTARNVLKTVYIVDPWFEWLNKRHVHEVTVWFRNITNFPTINITWQVSVHWLQWLLLQGDLLLLWSGSNTISAKVHSTAESH